MVLTSLRGLLLLSALACAGVASPQFAQAQIHRCTTQDGRPLYTDQACEALGATETPPEPAPSPNTGPKSLGAGRLYRGGCSRTLQDLAFEITSAIDAGDPNRLSGLYHWSGQSDAAANVVMDRLETIARRPLLDIAPVFPDAAADTTFAAARRPPTGLRLEQVAANGITPAPTVLGLERHFGCWWIRL